MRFIAVVVSLVGALSGQVLTASPAAACSCKGPSDEQAFDLADAVFVGDVISTPAVPTEGNWSSTDAGTWTFAVTEVYKGQVSPDQHVVSVLSSASCGLELPATGKVVVFGQSEPAPMQAPVDGANLYAYLCGGSRPLLDTAPPDSFGPPLAPTIAATDEVGASAADPDAVDGDERNLALPMTAGIVLIVLAAAAAATLIIRRRERKT